MKNTNLELLKLHISGIESRWGMGHDHLHVKYPCGTSWCIPYKIPISAKSRRTSKDSVNQAITEKVFIYIDDHFIE